MNIAVYCGSVSGNDIEYERIAEVIGTLIGKKGHTLVYGGSDTGLMGIVANAVMREGGKVIGVLPDVRLIHERKHGCITEYVYAENMSERKQKMIDLSDGFIALPGGYGTLDEFSDILCLLRIGVIDKPLALVNTNGFYDLIRAFFGKIEEAGFVGKDELEQVLFSDNAEAILKHMEYKTEK